ILKNSLYATLDKIQQWASGHHIARNEQIAYLKKFSTTVLESGFDFVHGAFSGTAELFTELVFFFLALFFFLYYRSFLSSVLFKCFNSSPKEKVGVIIKSLQKMVVKYILGLFFVIVITAALNTVGLLLLGIK